MASPPASRWKAALTSRIASGMGRSRATSLSPRNSMSSRYNRHGGLKWAHCMEITPRRQFVKAAAAAVATAQFPILGANDKVRVGIVGLGARGTNHMDFYSTLDSDCRIAA